MAGKHFETLDDRGLALHADWRDIGRHVVVVGAISLLTWGLCSLLRASVHAALHTVLDSRPIGWVPSGAWVLVLLLAGGALRGLLARFESWREVEGDGLAQTLASLDVTAVTPGDDAAPRYALPTFRRVARKFAATFLTLGSGASGGLEAPSVMMAEALGAGVSESLRVRSEHELRTYQLAAISAAVSTLLGAPFTAALFAAEIAYGNRIVYRELAYGLFAGVVAYWFNAWTAGAHVPLFTAPAHSPVYSLLELGGAALVAVAVSVPLALGFAQSMRTLERTLARRVRRGWYAVVSSLAVGVVALGLQHGAGIPARHVLGMGEETLGGLLRGEAAWTGAWPLLLVLAGKVLTTGLTLAGGGSAGLLIPSMYLGGVAGALVATLVNLTGWTHLDPALFSVVGMASSLVAVVGVPLAAMAFVLEVFGKAYGPPAILACGFTYLLTLRLKLHGARWSSHRAPAPALPG